MSIEYYVRENKLTVPISYTARPKARAVLQYADMASRISLKIPNITPDIAENCLRTLALIVKDELLNGNTVNLTNFVSFVTTIPVRLPLSTDLLPPSRVSVVAKPSPVFTAEVAAIATYTRLGVEIVEPVIMSAADSATGLNNWMREGFMLDITGANLNFNQADQEQGLFFLSPAGNTIRAENIAWLTDKKIIAMPEIDPVEGPAGKGSVEYGIKVKARYSPAGFVKTAEFNLLRKTNVIDTDNSELFVKGSASSGPAVVSSYTGGPMTARIIAQIRPDNVLTISAGPLQGQLGSAVQVPAAGVYDVPGLDGLQVEVLDHTALVQSVIAYQRYLVEVVDLPDGSGGGDVGISIFNVNRQKGIVLSVNPKHGTTNKYVVIIPDSNTHVVFWQDSNNGVVFKSIVSTISVNGLNTDLVSGSIQEWDDPSSLEGGRFEDAAFQYAGNGCISCSFGTFQIPLGWKVNEAGRSLQQITIQPEFYPSGYGRHIYGKNASMSYVPALNANLSIIENESSDDVYVGTFYSTEVGFTDIVAGSQRLWDPYVEGIRPIPTVSGIESRIYFAPCGQSGRGVYAALLGNDQNRIALITVLASSPPIKIFDYTFAALGTSAYPICIAGSSEDERICLIWADGIGNVLASLFDCSGATAAQIGTNLTLITGQGASEDFVTSCCWLPGGNQIVILWPGTSGTRTWIVEASATGLAFFDQYTSGESLINGYCHVGNAQLGIVKTLVRTSPAFFLPSFSIACDTHYGVPELVTSGQVVDINLAENGYKYIRIIVPASVSSVQMTMTDFSGSYPADIMLRRLYPPRWYDYDVCSWDGDPPPFDISLSNSGATTDRVYYGRVDAWEAMTAKISIVLS